MRMRFGNRRLRYQRICHGHAQRQYALEQEGTNQHMADLAAGLVLAPPIRMAEAATKPIWLRRGVQLHEAVALAEYTMNADRAQHGGQHRCR